MATDSTNLPQGEVTLDAGIDMTGSDLDLTMVQEAAASDPKNFVDLPKGNTVILLPVQPGQTVKLPTDSASDLLAKIGPEGNLAIVVDGRTIILQGYLKAHDQSPIKIVTNDGDTVDVADVIGNTDSSLDIQTAAGPASGNQGDGADGSGIYIPFLAGPGLGGILAEGILDPTALQYRLIDNEFKDFPLEEDTGPSDITITFDILGGVINEDDLPADSDNPDLQALALVIKDQGNDGTGNDPFDTEDRENQPGDTDDVDDVGGVDPDREPLTAQAFVKVTFGPDVPGTLWVDKTELPTDLTSEGQPIIFEVLPPSATQGNGIVAFVDGGGDPEKFDHPDDRRIFEIKVNEKSSNSEFTIDFTLYDNIDNVVPDKNDDGRADLLGGVEEILGLPVKVTAKDSDNTELSTVMNLGVEDDIPFFGEVHVSKGEGGIEITIDQRDADITHDETKDVDDGSDDQLEGDAQPWVQDAEDKVINAGFGLPEGDSKGALDPIGVAQTQVMASFGADQSTQEHWKKAEDPEARNSIFGELQDRDTQADGVNDGENERPFELFMTVAGTGGAPSEDDLDTLAVEGNLTIADQLTNATVTWDGGDILNVHIRQIDAQTIIGYVIPEGEPLPPAREVEGIDGENGEQAVFVLTIDDNGVMTFVQYHQLNHPESPDEHDEEFEIADANGDPLIHVRISDYDGDHAQQPVHLVVEDDGPKFKEVCFDHGNGTVDEDYLGKILNPGNHDLDNLLGGGNGDDQILDGTSASGKISFDFGADEPGKLSFGELVITDSKGKEWDISELKTADGNGITIVESIVGDNIVLTAIEDGSGDKVFTMTLDPEGGETGEFQFQLHQALQHPYTDSDFNNDDNPESAFEDNFNFAFNVVATDIDKDTAQGTINISVDDDSPTANDDHDEVTEGKTGGNLNFASGNVVTGGDASFLGKDSNFTFLPPLFTGDGTPDLPGADRPYTISKLQHDGNTYELSADGKSVSGLTDGDSYDDVTGVLTITTEEGGTFEIVMTSATPSLVGEYKYTVPANADHDHDKHAGPADLTTSTSNAFDTVGEWETSFAAAGITLVPENGSLALKILNISGPNYRGIGVGGGGDEVEVDNNGADQKLTLEIANPTDNIALTIGALYSGGPDGGFQEILLWQVYDADDNLIASGQILGSETGLVPLDIDTDGAEFSKVVLTPINNGAGESANNSDFVLVNAEICCPEDKFTEQFDYTLRDADGDEDTASICIDVKDTEPKVKDRDATITFLVDEDGIAGGLKNGSPQDDAETPGGSNVDNDGIFKGKIAFTPGADLVTIELSVGDPSQPTNGDTGLDTVDGKNVLAAWDPATSTLVGYIEGTDPSEAANRVFTVKVDNHQTGEFTFTLLKPVEHPDSDQSGNDNENNPNLSFKINFQIEDSDCDVAYGEMIVKIDDDMPVITQQSGSFSLIVDESLDGNTTPNNAGDHPHDPGDRIEDDEDGANLPTALTNIASLPGVGDVIGAAKTSGSSLFSFQPGADGLQSAVYSLTLGGVGPVATNLIDTLSGLTISLQGGFADGTVRGVTSGGDIVFAFSINAGTGEVSMAQYRAINHGAEEAAPGNHDEEKSLGAPASSTAPVLTNLLSVTLTVTDKDNDTVSSTVDITGKVKFEDDGPHAKIDKKHDNEVTHDESAGEQNDDQPLKDIPAIFPGGALGWAHSDDPIVTTSGTEYGQDGAGTTVLSLKIPGDGTNSGLDDTATGKDILLYQSGDLVLGKVAGSGELVFAVSIDEDGFVDVAQYRAIEHPDDDDDDEDVGISHDALQAWVTITDKDGDSDTDYVSIGSRIRFDDDGPKADIKLADGAVITLDESKDPAAADGFPDGNANDEAGNVGGDIAYGTIAGKALFEDKSSYGTDGAGTKSYSLVVSNGTHSGLFDSETNASIRLYQVNATTIEGRPEVMGVDPVSFTITIDPVTGAVTVSQLRAVEHDNAGSSASDHDESGSPEIMDKEKVFVRQTIIDGDKDHDTDDIDISKIIKFEDDGPIARNDVDSLDPIAGSKFESQGNVITGAAVTTPGIDDGGTDTPWVISNLVGSKTSDSNSSGGFNVTGTYGSLSMNTSGQYTYNFDETNSGKVPSGSTEVFTYTLRDSDGDTDTATLTIKLGEATVETSAIVNPETQTCIKEDTFGDLKLVADPGPGDIVTQIVLSNVPAGWDVKDDGLADFVIVGGNISGAPVFAGGQITFNITGAAPGADVTITVKIKGAPDSDVNGLNLQVGATVVDGVVFAKDTTNFDVVIDAVADGDDKGDDGDANKLSVTIDVTDGDDANASFQVDETGNVKVTASYDDFKDGSETHTLTVQAPTGFSFDETKVGTLPPGVVLDAAASDSDTLVFKVDSKDGDGLPGVASFELNIPVVYDGSLKGSVSGDFSATATATETPTDSQCDTTNDSDSVTKTDTVGIASPPEVRIDVGLLQGGECIFEDTQATFAVNAATDSASYLTSIVLTGLPAGWAYDFSGLDTDGAGTGVTVDTSVAGQVTVTFSPLFTESYNGTFKATPPADSDVDFGTLTGTVNAANDVDALLVASTSDNQYFETDAVADGKGPGFGDDGEGNVLSVSITVDDNGADGDTTFAANEIGTVKIGASFDDFKDGSEVHTVTIDAPAGFKFLSVEALSLPAGVTVQSLADGQVVLLVDSSDAAIPAGVGSFSDVLINVQNVSAPSGTTVTFTATAKAVETNLSGEECTPANNEQSVSATDDATTFTNQIPVAYDDKKCGDEAGPKNVNLLLVFDNSGSMDADSGIPGTTKLEAAKQAAINLLNAYAATGGDVRVMLVTFNSDSDREPTWLNLADAIDAIDDIPQSGGATNYEAAIQDAISGFNDTDGRGDFATHDNFVYFLSDGAPTTGGNPGDNSITDGTLTNWDNLLENPANQIDHVYAVGLGTGILGGASNPNLLDVARPDGDNNAPNTVVLVDDFNDLSATLTGTVGSLIEGNVLDGSIENADPDAPTPGKNNDADFQGDAPAHVSYFEYDHPSLNGLDIKASWDGSGNVEPGDVSGGTDTQVNGTKVSFDTEYGRMTFDFSTGDFDFLAGSIDGGDKEEHFTYKITDSNGDQSNPADLTVCIKDVFVDKTPITYDDVASGAEPAPKSVNLLLVFDNSGSMDAASGIPGTTKLEAAKQAAINLLNAYAATGGDVRVMLVTFNSDSDREGTWLNLADAIDAIDDIPQSGGATNYEAAIQDAIAGFNDTDGRGDFATHDNFVYFLSDGEPTTGGNSGDNSITDGTLANWDSLLENPANQIDHVYAVGLGTDIDGGASNPNLIDVARPDGDNNAPNTVILVDDFNDLSATLTGTIGTPIVGNILNGLNEQDPDGPLAGPGNDADNPGDAPAHLSHFEYDSADNDLDIKITWDGSGAVAVDGAANGKALNINGKEVSFDTDHGRMTIDFIDGDFKFLPDSISGGNKTEVFEYKTTDVDGDVSNESTLKVTIENIALPETNAGSGSGSEDAASIAVSLSGTDDNGTVTSFRITSLPANGTLYADAGLLNVITLNETVSAAGNAATVFFVPNPNFSGSPTFQYAAIDNDGLQDPSPATATITVTAVNDAPEAFAALASVNAQEQIALQLHGAAGGLSIADIDAGGNDVTVTLSVNFGSLTVSAGNTGVSVSGSPSSLVTLVGTVTEINNLLQDPGSFTGSINYNANSDNPPASATLTMTVNDGGNTGGGPLQDDVNVTINIAPTNDAPTTSNANAVGNEDAASIVINLSGADVDGSVAQFKITTLPTNGKLYADVGLTNEITANETVAALANAAAVYFVPNANYNGADSFKFTAIDNLGLADGSPATASITVNSVDDPTVATANHIYVGTDSSVEIQAAWLLRDDSDADNTLSVTSVDESSSKFGIDDGELGDSFTVDFGNSEPNGSADAFTYTLSTGTVVAGGQVHLDDNDSTISGGATNDIVVGTGSSNVLNGNGGNDVLIDGEGGDTLNGGDGDDFLDGGEDGDTYTGGKGNDTIDVGDGSDTVNYTSKLDGTDVINNFDDDGGQDVLNLDALFDSLTTATLSRAALVQITDNGSTVDIKVDADGIAGFELHVATINTTDTISVGSDVLVGTL